MTVGRNDPCPCGSGKKFKKCCLHKKEAARRPHPAPPAELRFLSPLASWCAQGAIAEALKPGGTVHIHPYALIKLRDDPTLLQTAFPEDRAQLVRSWRISSLAAMPTEEIETRITFLKVPYSRPEFIELAQSRRSAWNIGAEWSKRVPGSNAADTDFLGLAACELWRRLRPEQPSLEMLDDWICEGYAFLALTRRAEALGAWWKVWKTLRPQITPEVNNLAEANDRFFPHMSQSLSNWAGDFCLEAINGSLSDPRCGEFGIQFITELLQTLPGEPELLNFQADLATLYFHTQRIAEGEQFCEQMIRDHPDRAVGYAVLSDGLLEKSSKQAPAPVSIQRAIAILEQALARPVSDAEDFDLAKRLTTARELVPKTVGS
jgi:SEC-C motif